jgi:hypothetical protein
VSFHTNAGGGHGTETLYLSEGGKLLAGKVNAALVGELGYADRGLKRRTDLHVLNATSMYAVLAEAVFHDCTTSSGQQGHPPAETAFLRSAEGQQKIAAGYAAGICAYFDQRCEPAPPPKAGWLKGTVFRAPNMDDRLAGAKVSAGDKSTVTSAEGLFELELPAGTYTVTATADGFLSSSLEAEVVAGEEVWASLGLDRADGDAGPPAHPGGDGARRQPIADGCGCAAAAQPPACWLLALSVAVLLLGRCRS